MVTVSEEGPERLEWEMTGVSMSLLAEFALEFGQINRY